MWRETIKLQGVLKQVPNKHSGSEEPSGTLGNRHDQFTST